MPKSFFFLIAILLNIPFYAAHSQSDDKDTNACAEIELKYDVELMKTPPNEIERGSVLDHEVELSDLHLSILSEVFKNCGEPANVEVSGVSTSGPLEYSGPVIQRQMASRRIIFFADWAVEQGMSRAKINVGSVGKQEPSPASLILSFRTFEPVQAIVRTFDEPVVLPEETETSCNAPKEVFFSPEYDAEAARQALSAYLNDCGAAPRITFQLGFDSLNDENLASWSSWNEMLVEVQRTTENAAEEETIAE